MANLPATQDEIRLVGTLARLRKYLDAAIDDVQRLEIRDDARLVVLIAKEKCFKDIAVAASEMVARAERAISKAHPPHKGGRGKRCEPCSHLSREALRKMRAIHSKLTDEEFETRVAEHHELGVPITRKSLRDGPCAPGMSLRSGRQEWWTPSPIVEAARYALGSIDLDVASCQEADEIVRAARFFDREIDALSQDWNGRVWMNPPFADGVVDKFVNKLISEPDVSAWCALLNNTTETVAGQIFLASSHILCFPASRLRFRGPDAAGKQGTPLMGQMIGAHFRVAPAEGIARFYEAFKPLGVVLPGGASLAREEVPRC